MKRGTAKLLVIVFCILMLVIPSYLFATDNPFLAAISFIVLSFIAMGINGRLCCKKCGLHPRSWLASYCPHCGEPLE